ncbi:hypothetical protein KC725_00085 [Candidatus Peregrinibacteria bacterium]|nr:hypothetical protein [Candidatus Peregrinibacteria bacterium]
MDDREKAFLQELEKPEGLDSWKRRPEDQRDTFISLMTKSKVISPAQGYLLTWLPQSEHFTLTDYLCFAKIIKSIRTRLLERMDTERPPQSEPAPSTERSPTTIAEEEVDQSDEYYDYELLTEEEITDRFSDLGINIQKILSEWHDFYWRKHYAEREIGSNYSLPLPDMTEEAMNAFERAWIRGDIDTIMIDDSRIKDGKALKYLQTKTSRKTVITCDQFRPISPESMQDFLAGRLINLKKGDKLSGKERRKLQRCYEFDDLDERGVRFVGLKTGFAHIDFERLSFPEAADILDFTYTNVMEFGTWVRFLHYLIYNGNSQYDQYLDNISRIKNGYYYIEPEVLLNSFTPYGEFVTATAYRNRIAYHTKANPSSDPTGLNTHATPIVVVQSDSHPNDDYENDDDIPF